MFLFDGILENFLGILQLTLSLFLKGGWVFVVFLVLYMLYQMYRGEIEHQFIHAQEWVFLNIKVPRENLVSSLAVETIFSQMHALHSSLTFPQIYVEGKTQLWYSLELVSLGGKISFIIRTPKKVRDLVEASVYSHYPTAEISVVSDYMENLSYDPKTSDFDIFGFEWRILEDDVIPIKTYRDFEHPTAEEKIIDPLSNHFEALTKMQPWEMYAVQIIIQPLGDKEWKPKGEAKVKELMGEEVPHEAKFSDLIMAPLNWVAHFSFKDLILGGGHGHGHDEGSKPKNNWQFMTDLQKDRVNLVERKISKPGYKTKIRHLYMAPKDKVDGTKKGLVIGSYRALGSVMTNQFKPDTKWTWTGLEYKISPTLEQPFIEKEVNERKRVFFQAFKERDIHKGTTMFILNVEELATLYHFPISATGIAAPVEATASKKSAPPVNLPVADS